MQKEYLHEVIDRNYPIYRHNFNFEVKIFHELKTQIYEINACLVCGLNRASITLTNNFIERLMKHALIYSEIGVGPINSTERDKKYTEAHNKYSSENLNMTIKICKENQLINEKELKYLKNIKDLFRNGFSHADTSKILHNLSPKIPGTRINTETGEITDIILNPKTDLPIQELAIEKIVDANASLYFKDSIQILKNIEVRLLQKI